MELQSIKQEQRAFSYHIWSGVNKSSSGARSNSGLRVGGLTVYGASQGHGGIYRCTPFSSVGYSLTVVGGALTNSHPHADGLKILSLNGVATFTCNTTKSDGTQRSVDWYHNMELLETEDEITVKPNGTLIIDPVKEEHVGTYECKARTNEVLRSVTAIFFSYKVMPKSGTAIEGDKLTLTCEVEGIPRPIISWTKDNTSLVEELGAERVEFRTDEDNDKAPENATVVISDIKPDDRGTYKCTIRSDGIVKETQTYIRVKDIYAALWPFLGILVEVVVLCLVIFIYEKRRTKNDFDESDTDQGNGKGGN
ncbi:Immunoglobulin I-set [Trinorchestia longiramus]|nr:Immunoglobulin I-set [Trinorchestia longiramus]